MNVVTRFMDRVLGINRCRACGGVLPKEYNHSISGERGYCTHCWGAWVLMKNAMPGLDDASVLRIIRKERRRR